MANEIVKYNNDVSNLGLTDFTATELNILMSLLVVCKDKECELIKMPYKKLEELSQFSRNNRKRFLEELHSTAKKLHQLSIDRVDDDGMFQMFHLFETIRTLDNDLELRVNKDFTYILNGFIGNYTSFELAEFNSLKSTYSKNAYREIKRYKTTGFWRVEMDKFRRLLDIPDKYASGDITRRVINVIEKELPNYFEDFAVEVIKDDIKDPRKITGYLFKWKPEGPNNNKYAERSLKKIKYNCPACGGELYEIEKGDGTVFFGHKDGWRDVAPCRMTYSTIAEILGRSETPNREECAGEEGIYASDNQSKFPTDFKDVMAETISNVKLAAKTREEKEEMALEKIPELKAVFDEMDTLNELLRDLMTKPKTSEQKNEVKEKKKALNEKMKMLLIENGFEEDYLD